MGPLTALDELRTATILDGMRAADALTIAASRDGGTRAVRLLARAAVDSSDQLTAIAAVHALGQVFDDTADDALVALLGHDADYLREHAAWAFGSRLPRLDAIAGLIRLVAAGGFSGMLAQRTLEQWGASAPDSVALALEGALIGINEADARARLVETIGLVAGRIPDRLLRRVAAAEAEPPVVRAAAVAALGDRPSTEAGLSIVTNLSFGSDELAAVARLALFDLTVPSYPRPPWSQGLTVAQLFLHADIDGELSQVGAGDNGGIATLLVRLGDALVARGANQAYAAPNDQVERVITISRGGYDAALTGLATVGSTLAGHSFAAVPFPGGPMPAADAWPRRIAAQRGIRRILRAAGTVDAIHLRMADVGSLAAATVARELDIPVVFTVAPDPHAVINSLEHSGALSHANFGTVDAVEHFWFRARLVQRLAADAEHTVLFPRPELERDMRDLVGIDVTAHPERHSVIAEGIDLAVIEQSRADALASAAASTATATADAVRAGGEATADAAADSAADFGDLDALLATLPPERRGLPLIISVGRLHRVKGMAALVTAWATTPTLRARVNVLIVGGDLQHPSSDEQQQLQLMAGAVPVDAAAAHGLLLAGHRGNDTVARWLAAVRVGRPGFAASHGVYVCASVKEEFGLAVLEAMASGLTVVAPAGGGPATYVEDGVTGLLVDTGDQAALAAAMAAALDLAEGPFGADYAERARRMVADNFTIQAMARALTGIYRDVAAANEPLAWALSAS
ncbi:glycosyltransferase [Cryobacterium melibiosiphilum]|uniref:D-inositol 3-phosphate glycosyltransferase n=1 Tax=Cryobacterium melibiosiphilum TaxID=995039 RepID=A0A3A5MDN4_9MICO|nr:glycosyltransferase [Cryobacterium melibiosiphilum]RJT88227.1 glycosyltransferase [Cryobacterium melibiosiphilum]